MQYPVAIHMSALLLFVSCAGTALQSVETSSEVAVKTLVTTCDGALNCDEATSSVGERAKLTCTDALNDRRQTEPPQCRFLCSPACGSGKLTVGASAYTTGRGMVTLSCWPEGTVVCKLDVQQP